MNVWQIILVAWLAPALIIAALALAILLRQRVRSHEGMSDRREQDELP